MDANMIVVDLSSSFLGTALNLIIAAVGFDFWEVGVCLNFVQINYKLYSEGIEFQEELLPTSIQKHD